MLKVKSENQVSHAAAREIPAGIWKKILKQLKVSEAEFWEGLKKQE